jgi:hypothetical protein
MKKTVRIITSTGKTIERKAEITDWIDNQGRQSSTARVGRTVYRVIDRDAVGAVFGR